MWTEITKDLVVREAIEELGYEYEETKQFFYIMDYLRYVSRRPPLPRIQEENEGRERRTNDVL